ncbi:MAG: DUF3857 domain-containing protein [Terracidiphilus sp.]|jgi:hypothetical protein
MRIPVFVRSLPVLLVVTSPALILAQFQKPTSEELRMTADPKAPGAAAVYLNVVEAADDDLHFHSFYARIKVLQEKGKELATVEIPYVTADSTDTRYAYMPERFQTRVEEIKARTIHADGTVIPLTGKPEDLMGVKTVSSKGDLQINRKVFNLPSVEVGSILEYYFKVRFDDHFWEPPDWNIQKAYFVHKAQFTYAPHGTFKTGSIYSVDPSGGGSVNHLIWWPVLPAGAAVKKELSGVFSLDMNDVPPLPDEDWMPPLRNFGYKVVFYYKFASDNGDYWAYAVKDWSKDVDHIADPSKPIHEAVAGLIAPGDSDLEKARKLYKAVQALDNTDFSRKKSESELKQLNIKQSKTAQDILAQKSGSGEEIALLYLAMLRAAGLSARAMKIADRDENIFDPSYLTFRQLEDTIISLKIGGDEILLDPGQKMCPFQKLHWKHNNASGFLEGSDGVTPDHTPPPSYMDNNTTRKADITLDSQGGMQGALRFTMVGQQALHWRQIALRNDEDEVKKQFDRWLETIVPEGVEARIDHFAGLDNPDVNLVAFVNAKGTLGTATGKRLLLPGFFFETRSRQPFVGEENRQEPVDMQYSEVVDDEVVYRFPAGLAVEGAPQDARISWPSKAILATSSMPVRGQITITRTLSRGFTFVMKNQYQDLRAFYQKVAASDQQQLVLTSSPVPKGN